jgi:hypothetical protein
MFIFFVVVVRDYIINSSSIGQLIDSFAATDVEEDSRDKDNALDWLVHPRE